jgi:hypothetical protein
MRTMKRLRSDHHWGRLTNKDSKDGQRVINFRFLHDYSRHRRHLLTLRAVREKLAHKVAQLGLLRIGEHRGV